MARKKQIPIKYTSRDFISIKSELIEHARRYYSETYKDFSAASFGSLVIDTVSYVGDVLSFYLDYQANESFMETAIESENVRRHAKNLGYKYNTNSNSFGFVSLYIIVPSNSDGSSPDFSYVPILKWGSSFKSSTGAEYSLTENVDFGNAKNDIVSARFDSTTGMTTHFAIRAIGQVVSGQTGAISLDLTSHPFEKFKRVRLGGTDITEVISITDNEGHIWYEVDNLSQEIVFLDTTNRNAFNDGVPSIIKPFVAARRFVVDQGPEGTYLQFGNGSDLSTQVTGLLEPTRVGMKLYGKRNISSLSFDPTHLINSGKLGMCPSGKHLRAVVKINPFTQGYSSPVGSINTALTFELQFEDPTSLDPTIINSIIDSLEVNNDDPIVGSNEELTKDEIKIRARAHYAMQNRAVTAGDYESLVYSMPPNFGTVKRCNIINDPSSANRRLAMYVISENEDGHLTSTNNIIKNNLKNWISIYRSINDVVDILDAKVVNFGVEFSVVTSAQYNSQDVIQSAIYELQEYFKDGMYIGEPLYLSEIYRALNSTPGVVDVKNVKINIKSGGVHSANTLDLDEILSRDGTYYKVPKNVIMELKFHQLDIKGIIR